MNVILVPHPSPEPELPGPGWVPWNTGKHCRKFLSSTGRYLEGLEKPSCDGELYFWGEYEAPTITRPVPKLRADGARYVHTPAALCAPVTKGAGGTCSDTGAAGCSRGCQNTDPWLWHDGFTWTVCKHTHRRDRLRRLITEWCEPAIVLFGSVTKGQWVLDTVLVAGDDQRPARDLGQLRKEYRSDAAYRRLVLDRLQGFRRLRPIRGTAYAPPKGNMFSFVPATNDFNHAFARPPIGHLFSRLVKNNDAAPSMQNARSLTRCSIRGTTRDFWDALVKAVTDQGLVLAIQFAAPSAWDTLS